MLQDVAVKDAQHRRRQLQETTFCLLKSILTAEVQWRASRR